MVEALADKRTKFKTLTDERPVVVERRIKIWRMKTGRSREEERDLAYEDRSLSRGGEREEDRRERECKSRE